MPASYEFSGAEAVVALGGNCIPYQVALVLCHAFEEEYPVQREVKIGPRVCLFTKIKGPVIQGFRGVG